VALVEQGESPAVGRLTRDGSLVGFIAIDSQLLHSSQRQGLRTRRWSEVRRRFRLDLLDDWAEDFIDAQAEIDLAAGSFRFKGELLAYEELIGDERKAVLSERFANWT
jgi:hypothetical protein